MNSNSFYKVSENQPAGAIKSLVHAEMHIPVCKQELSGWSTGLAPKDDVILKSLKLPRDNTLHVSIKNDDLGAASDEYVNRRNQWFLCPSNYSCSQCYCSFYSKLQARNFRRYAQANSQDILPRNENIVRSQTRRFGTNRHSHTPTSLERLAIATNWWRNGEEFVKKFIFIASSTFEQTVIGALGIDQFHKLTVSEQVREFDRSEVTRAISATNSELLSDDGSTADEYEDAHDVDDMFMRELTPSRPQPLSTLDIFEGFFFR